MALESNKTIFSFEIFPPKKNMPIETIFNTLDELKDLRPDFISVTFGAGGSENCDNALAIASRIKNECKVDSVIHMPCINMTKQMQNSVLNSSRMLELKIFLHSAATKSKAKNLALILLTQAT